MAPEVRGPGPPGGRPALLPPDAAVEALPRPALLPVAARSLVRVPGGGEPNVVVHLPVNTCCTTKHTFTVNHPVIMLEASRAFSGILHKDVYR